MQIISKYPLKPGLNEAENRELVSQCVGKPLLANGVTVGEIESAWIENGLIWVSAYIDVETTAGQTMRTFAEGTHTEVFPAFSSIQRTS
jgi:hypothetical protein